MAKRKPHHGLPQTSTNFVEEKIGSAPSPSRGSRKRTKTLMSPTNSVLTKTGIVKPHQHDVLCGRGGLINRYPGNLKYRTVVEHNKELYHQCSKNHKILVSVSVVEAIGRQEPPGRFLEEDKATGYWTDIGRKRAIQKTSQALREGAKEVRKKLKADGNLMDDTTEESNETSSRETTTKSCVTPENVTSAEDDLSEWLSDSRWKFETDQDIQMSDALLQQEAGTCIPQECLSMPNSITMTAAPQSSASVDVQDNNRELRSIVSMDNDIMDSTEEEMNIMSSFQLDHGSTAGHYDFVPFLETEYHEDLLNVASV